MRHDLTLLLALLLALAACSPQPVASYPAPPLGSTPALALAETGPGGTPANARIQPAYPPGPSFSAGQGAEGSAGGAAPAGGLAANAGAGGGAGDITLNFADTDLRSVVAEMLGSILRVNYTIDPGVSGSVTLHTVRPLTQAEIIPTLQTLLAQNGAVLVQSGGMYRVMPAGGKAGDGGLAGSAALGGSAVVALRYASAPDLATVLQPFVTKGGGITADPTSNAVIISGDPSTRAALEGLVQAFDIDALAGQSYAVYPVSSGNVKDFAQALQAALVHDGAAKPGQKVASALTVIPLERISAVLVITRSPELLDEAARAWRVLAQAQAETARSWRVFYLRNTRANDAAYLLQEAFTPDNVTAQPTPDKVDDGSSSMFSNSGTSGGAGGSSGGASAGLGGGSGGLASGAGGQSGIGQSALGASGSDGAPKSAGQGGSAGASALLGALSATATNTASTSEPRIIPDPQNNAVLVYATAGEANEITGMLAKLDIQPLQVRIDAIVAEVDLTGKLQYGTQFFFKSGDINAVLSNATTSALATSFPGFVLSGNGSSAAPLAISALQDVTKVKVLSSPELMVLDGQAANLQVGQLVPYLTQTSQSTQTANTAVINSVDYRETGIILKVTPHVGNDGLVTLDVRQEVSGVANGITTAGLDSPTFTERVVTSRIAIQDGQTVGLAGLISDNDSHENSGIPGLKNIPLLSGLFSTQTNNRTRQELLVLITPHVIRNQQQALDLTADMEQVMPNAAMVNGQLQTSPVGGSPDPTAALRARFAR
ncbi:type II secretion system secretin GspD [Acidisoma sp. C75]